MARAARNPLSRCPFLPTLPLRLQVERLEDRSVPSVFLVTNDLNDGSGSLRQAILNSDALVGADEVRFDPGFFAVPRTITLTTAELRVRDDLTVTGPGAGLLAVSGKNARRVFNIDDGSFNTRRSVRIEGLTITGGRAFTGGGIFNRESLDLARSVVSGNTTTQPFSIDLLGGGGIDNSGTMTITDTIIAGNTSLLDGGGGGVFNTGSLTLIRTTVSGNTATKNGGGISNLGRDLSGLSNPGEAAPLTLIDSTVSGNSAGRDGGGIANLSLRLGSITSGSAGSLSLINSTVTGNTAGRDGGGVATASSSDYYDGTSTSSSLINTTVSDNRAGRDGGGVASSAILAVAHTVISGNTAERDGGGVSNYGPLTLTNSTVSGNSAEHDGGGLVNAGGDYYSSADITLTNSTVSGNTAVTGSGGGVQNTNTLTLTNSTVSGNHAGLDGGGVANLSTLTVISSTVSGNTTGRDGGGASNTGTLTLVNSTVSGNTAVRSAGGLSNGGVFEWEYYGYYYSYPDPGRATLTQVTVAGNDSPSGGNIVNAESSRLTLANTIVADAAAGGDVFRAGGGDQVILFWVNLVEDGSVTGTGVINADPKLGPLADNGGPTKTHAPLPGSPAIDAGDNAVVTLDFLTDQRGAGFSRLRGAGRVDLGAVEAQPTGPVTLTAVDTLAREGDPAANALVFAIRRTSDPSAPLDVPAALAGTATPGDYVVSVAGGVQTPTGFRFDAGSAEMTVTLAVVDDPSPEPAEMVILTVGPATDVPADVALAVIDRDFDTQVTTTADNSSGSLRLALRNADDRPGADVVTFDPAVFSTARTITLTTGALTIRTDVTIAGPGAGLLTVSGNNASRVFSIGGGGDTLRSVRIEGLTVTSGRATEDGGGIWNSEALELVECTVSGNKASGDGGGIANQSGSLQLIGSTVSGNTAGRDGGGVSNAPGYSYSDASATLVDCTVSGNTAGRDGGGIANQYSSLSLQNSTVSGNTAGRDGGGLSNRGYFSSYYYGTDYYDDYSMPARATLSQVTVAGNAAPTGGNIANGEAGKLTLANSIVADAVPGGDVSRSGDGELLTLFGVNLVEDGSVTGPGVINADPLLGPLADNGGPTKTRAPLPGSPAFNAAAAPIPATLTTDQRGTGFGRTRGGGVDLGAFEVQSSRITAATDTPTTAEDTAVTVAVLANDTDEYGTPLRVTAAGDPSSGTVVLNPDGTVTYTPAADFNGTATFTYTVTNAFGDTATGTVRVTITAVNDAPTVTVPAAQTTAEDVPVTITGISVADVDVSEGTGWVRVTLRVGFGTLTVPTGVAGGLTAGHISGNGTGWVVLEGPLAAVNATLAAGVMYLGNVNFSGNDALRVVVNDLGNTGAGGPLEAASVPIRVVSAADQIADLRARVVALGAQGVLNGGQMNSLLVKLDHAALKLADGKVKVAYNLIGAFINEVEALQAGGVLTPAQADSLLVPARRLRQSLIVGGGF